MANIFQSENLENDFVKFQETLLTTNEFKFDIDETIKPVLKKYHRLTYVVALFQDKMEKEYELGYKYLFVNEILSDLLSNCSIVFIGYYYSSQILTRRLIENFYNHIYYFNHSIEFELLNLGKNEYTPIIELRRYIDSHPRFQLINDDDIKKNNDSIFMHYQNLCRVVHTKGHGFMGLAKNLEEIKPLFQLKEHFEEINQTLLSMIYILYKFHSELQFTNTEIDIVAKSFPRPIRGKLLG